MKRNKICSLLCFLLHMVMLIGCLPLGVLAFPGSDDYRGSYMSEDDNGVMLYDDLEPYFAKSIDEVVLSTNYTTQGAADSTTHAPKTDTRYPDLTVDISIYYDKSIEGTNVIVRHGLSEVDSVTYIDSTTGETVKGKSPKELTGSNGGDPTYNGGYAKNEKGENVVHYSAKSVLFYIINHNCSARIGTEDDISILTDYIKQGYFVVVLDYQNHKNAISPYIEQSLVAARNMFAGTKQTDLFDAAGKPLTPSVHYAYFLPEGCRLERDIWYYDPSIWSESGVMEQYMETWNHYAAGSTYDVNGTGELVSVEDMITRLKQRDGVTPIDYKYTLYIIYPSLPKDNYKTPVYVQEGTATYKELGVQTAYTRCTFMGFALNGYTAVQYDHSFHPFLNRDQYGASTTQGNYGISYDLYDNARAAVRCTRYLADKLGYSAENLGAGGISKATIGLAILAVRNNKDYRATISGYDKEVSIGDVFEDGVLGVDRTVHNRLKAIVQPFMTYDDGTEISSDTECCYIAGGGGTTLLYGSGPLRDYVKVPTGNAEGLRDEYGCFNRLEGITAAFEESNDQPFLIFPMLDQNHTFPVGYDDQYGFDRHMALIQFFDTYLKPDVARAPEVLWITPINNSTQIPLTAKWTVGPFTPYGKEVDSYEQEQQIQVRFVAAVDPDSVNEGLIVKDTKGNVVNGNWIPSQNDALYTFETYDLEKDTTYTITATSAILSKNGTPLEEERSVRFSTGKELVPEETVKEETTAEPTPAETVPESTSKPADTEPVAPDTEPVAPDTDPVDTEPQAPDETEPQTPSETEPTQTDPVDKDPAEPKKLPTWILIAGGIVLVLAIGPLATKKRH
ncbi:MAG: Ig-like domain-containing protein [Clostridia bacterium]|nr:Ig-like domain-containing protein [Clostridia bacterium]